MVQSIFLMVQSIFLMVKSHSGLFEKGLVNLTDPGFHFPAGFSLLVMLISNLASRGGRRVELVKDGSLHNHGDLMGIS
jgi:hypothetical protein